MGGAAHNKDARQAVRLAEKLRGMSGSTEAHCLPVKATKLLLRAHAIGKVSESGGTRPVQEIFFEWVSS